MGISKSFIFTYILFIISWSVKAQILPVPVNPSLVTDSAFVLGDEQITSLENRLVAINDSTSNQIAVVTIKTLNGLDVADYGNQLLREWGIGTKKNNNGILILVALQEHKIRIEVGSGLEGAIPDIMAKNIIDNDLTPAFKGGYFYEGLNKAITSLSAAAAGEYHIRKYKDKEKSKESLTGWIVGLFLLVTFILEIIMGVHESKKGGVISGSGVSYFVPVFGSGYSGGGGFGGGGGGFGGFGGGGGGGGGASGGW